MLHPLSNSNYLFGLHMLLLTELKSADLLSLLSVCETISTDTQYFLCFTLHQEQV
jgi:hypothetical protein